MIVKKIQFTAEQLAIINTTIPRVFVSACAGSGKTHTLNARVRRLLDRKEPAKDILVLCFSNTAVGELKKRLPETITVRTFHSFALDLVRSTAGSSATRPVLLSSQRSVALLEKTLLACAKTVRGVCEKTGITLRTPFETRRLAAFFKRCNGSDDVARRLVDDGGSDFSDYADVLAELRVIRITYEKRIERAGGIDYPAMLRRACSSIENVSLPYTHVLVDEAQDMDAVQMQLLAGLAKRVRNLMIFGDPNQAVYSFIGGKARDLREVIRDVVTLPLSRSFRLTHENAALANAILGGSKRRTVGDRHGVTPSLTQYGSVIEQEDEVVKLIGELKDSGVPGNHIAILSRTKAPLRAVEQALLAAGHETNSVYSPRLPAHFDRVLDMLSVVQVCASTARVGLKPKRLWRTRRLREIIGKDVRSTVLDDCLRMLAKSSRIPSFEGRYVMATRIYLRLARASGDMPKNLASELGRWQATSRRFRTVRALREHIATLRMQAPVVTSSIHGAKGGEWDYVIVLGVTEGSIPFYREIKRNEIVEERRLFYVAVTRARKQLHLLHAPFFHAPSRQKFVELSRFVVPAYLQRVLTVE
ncbi:DNA helicase-2/ATP-dependent DNA helicase PcrA [Paraburkholderia tropica]|uniref:DNA 3'-5' helicase n=2 Tax=Paraburkholderia tropica TaxID=92647 RepID=A0ABX5MJX3_9BURK|nr:DNA helicase-2/ATP-dependent DNA helicase PcrA [Paraburkholderia tropica]PZW78518.1 DNA helicase-2/ATP-dependent DNA helicase PcrA [Paraburkholderia tropica]